MIRLLDPAASVTSEIGVEPEPVDDPKTTGLLAKSERCVGAGLQERDVVAFRDRGHRRVVEELSGSLAAATHTSMTVMVVTKGTMMPAAAAPVSA